MTKKTKAVLEAEVGLLKLEIVALTAEKNTLDQQVDSLIAVNNDWKSRCAEKDESNHTLLRAVRKLLERVDEAEQKNFGALVMINHLRRTANEMKDLLDI